MMPSQLKSIAEKLPPTALLKLFGLAKIPLLFATNPKVVTLDSDKAEVRLPLNYVNKNHVGCMYFGALAVGADCVVAILALQLAKEYSDYNVVPIFKDFKADFTKRAEDDVLFVCSEGKKIKAMIDQAIQSGERVTEPIEASAICPDLSAEAVAKFTLGLSLKATPKKKH